MWLFVLFDLPTETKKDRFIASRFRTNLKKDGFSMFQFSVYIRHCGSKENADAHRVRVKKLLPASGQICLFNLTDKQFGDIEIFFGKKRKTVESEFHQLELF